MQAFLKKDLSGLEDYIMVIVVWVAFSKRIALGCPLVDRLDRGVQTSHFVPAICQALRSSRLFRHV
jgi:hypothetical protein